MSRAAALRSNAKQQHSVVAQEAALTGLLSSMLVSCCWEQACSKIWSVMSAMVNAISSEACTGAHTNAVLAVDERLCC